ncbi:reverse transcriptase domain-containing protein [Tanacetum coccineum]
MISCSLRRNEKETPADFLVDIPFEDNKKKEKPKEVPDSNSKWILYTDRASNSDGSRAGLMLIDPKGKEYIYALRFEFETTNNEAKYEAWLAGLRIAQEMEIAKVAIFLDSQLLVNQIKGTFAVKQTSIKDYLQKVKTVLGGFEEYTVEHVCGNQNKKADGLSKLASMTFEHLTKEVLMIAEEFRKQPREKKARKWLRSKRHTTETSCENTTAQGTVTSMERASQDQQEETLDLKMEQRTE